MDQGPDFIIGRPTQFFIGSAAALTALAVIGTILLAFDIAAGVGLVLCLVGALLMIILCGTIELTWRLQPRSTSEKGQPGAVSRTYNTFGEIEGKFAMLGVECTRCGWEERYDVAKLIAQYGRQGDMMQWMSDLKGDCSKRDNPRIQDRCDLICPDLPKVL